MRFFRFVSFLSAAFPSKAALTLALTFCRKDATNLTFTSDSSNAAVISLSVASRTFSGVQSILHKIGNERKQTFSSTTGARFRDESAALSLRPRSVRTIFQLGLQ